MHDPGLFDTMYHCRAMRRLRPDPVPMALIHKVIEAGTMAPSGGNRQPWRFVVVTSPEKKGRIHALYKPASDAYVRMSREQLGERYGHIPPERARMLDAVAYLGEHLAEAPVLLFPYVREYKAQEGPGVGPAGSIYPAIQNMLLACRALGLGATLTGFMAGFHTELQEILGAPAEYCPVGLLPIGWPQGRFGPTRRKPVEDVAFLDRWDAPFRLDTR